MFKKQASGATENRKKSGGIGTFFSMLFGAILTLMIIGAVVLWDPLGFNSTKAKQEQEYQVQPKIDTDKDNPNYEFYDVLPEQEMVALPNESVMDKEEAQQVDVRGFVADVVVTQQQKQQSQPQGDTANFGISEETMLNPEDNSKPKAVATGEAQIAIVEEAGTYEDDAKAATAQTEKKKRTYILQINSFGTADEADRRRAQVLMAGVDAKVVKMTTANDETIYQVVSSPMDSREVVMMAQKGLQNNGIDSLIVEQRR